MSAEARPGCSWRSLLHVIRRFWYLVVAAATNDPAGIKGEDADVLLELLLGVVGVRADVLMEDHLAEKDLGPLSKLVFRTVGPCNRGETLLRHERLADVEVLIEDVIISRVHSGNSVEEDRHAA